MKKICILLMLILTSIMIYGCSDSSPASFSSSDNKAQPAASNSSLPKDLIENLCLSESVHYNDFSSEPDEKTTNILLQKLVTKKLFRWADIVTQAEGIYVFSATSEDGTSETSNISPDTLYKDYFENGKYKNPPSGLKALVSATQTGVNIKPFEIPYSVKVGYKGTAKEGDLTKVTVSISRSSKLSGETANIGDAVITLKEEGDTCFFDYKIVSFQPKYDSFEDLSFK